MKNQLNYIISCSLLIFIFFSSCKEEEKTDNPSPNQTGTLKIEFDNVAGNQNLVFSTEYDNTNTPGQKLKFNFLQYFISNIKLKDSKGVVYTVPQDSCYFLIKEQDLASQTVSLKNIPEADYTEITFVIGVDSIRSASPIEKRTGSLDINGAAKGMYWSWNSGYIFLKMEGTSPQAIATANPTGAFRYHIGGFGGFSAPATNNIRTKTIAFNNDKAMVRANKTPKVHLMLDVLKVLNSNKTSINMATTATVHGGPLSVNIADNIVEAFGYDHLHN